MGARLSPEIEGDDPTMYFERLSRDGTRGIIIPKHPAPGPVTIRPKGLNPGREYLVWLQESDRSEIANRRRIDEGRHSPGQDGCPAN